MLAPERNSACRQLARVASRNRTLLQFRRPSHKASPECEGESDNNTELGQAAGPHVPVGFGVRCNFYVSNRKHSHCIFLLITSSRLWGLELIKEVHTFWFEQMNSRVANLGTWMPSSFGVPCGEDFHTPHCWSYGAKSTITRMTRASVFAGASSPISQPLSHHTSPTCTDAHRSSLELRAKFCQQERTSPRGLTCD